MSGLFRNAEDQNYSYSKKISLFKENNQKIAIKLANVHFEAKKICKNSLDKFSNKDFSGRTLKFIYNSIKNRENYEEQIISAIEDCYSIAYNDPKKLTNQLLKEFEKEPSLDLIQYLKKDEDNENEKYKDILNLLNNFLKNPSVDFNISDFINSCGFYTYQNIPELIKKIDNVLNKIKNYNKYFTIFKILNNILNEFVERKKIDIQEYRLDDKFLMKEINLPSIAKDKLLKYSQGKLFLLNTLIKNGIFPKIKWIDLFDYLKEKNKNLFDLCPNDSDDVTNAISIIFIYPQLFPSLYDIAKKDNDINKIIQSLSDSDKEDSVVELKERSDDDDKSNSNDSNSDSEKKSNSSSSSERKKKF